MLRAGYPTLLPWRGGGTIYPGSSPADVTTRSPRMVAEYLLTRSMFKMFIPFHGMCMYMYNCIYSQSVHADVYLVYFVLHSVYLSLLHTIYYVTTSSYIRFLVRNHFIWLVTTNVLSSLPMCTKIIIYGLVKKFVKPLFIFWIIFLLDLELNFTDKL